MSTNDNDWTDWFADGELNTSYLALDYHVEQGRGDQIALIYDSPVTNTKQKFTYLELTELVAKFAGVLQNQTGKKRRPCSHLYANDSTSSYCDASLR